MVKRNPISLYNKYHLDRNDERIGLFSFLSNNFDIERVLYAGSFVHVTPSFFFPRVVYVDNAKQAKHFFNDEGVVDFILKRKRYAEKPTVTFRYQDYREDIGEPNDSFDLLISLYAGFVSQFCKKYLKTGGLLLTNNSHGDASMASIDSDYKFVGVLKRRNDQKYAFSDTNLDTYFIPKKPIKITKEHLEKIQRGIGYTKYASAYLFRKTN